MEKKNRLFAVVCCVLILLLSGCGVGFVSSSEFADSSVSKPAKTPLSSGRIDAKEHYIIFEESTSNEGIPPQLCLKQLAYDAAHFSLSDPLGWIFVDGGYEIPEHVRMRSGEPFERSYVEGNLAEDMDRLRAVVDKTDDLRIDGVLLYCDRFYAVVGDTAQADCQYVVSLSDGIETVNMESLEYFLMNTARTPALQR